MKLIHPSVELLQALPAALTYKIIEKAGRTAYKSESGSDENTKKFVKKIITSKHHSVLEHASITFKWVCDRGVSHELVRHRIASYTQESTRYCDYTKNKFGGQLTFIIPSWTDLPEGNADYDLLGTFTIAGISYHNQSPELDFLRLLSEAEKTYERLLAKGWKSQHARAILPNALKTEIVVTMDWREIRHMLTLRTAPDAHPDMIKIATMTKELLINQGYGLLLEDI